MESLAESAVACAKRGWSVFPLAERDKTPAIKGGFKAAMNDPVEVGKYWERRPNANLGIATGGPSNGLVVIDLDVDPVKGEDGLETLHEWEREHGELPETVTAETGSGGMHLFYVCDEPVDCSVDNELGVDIRGDGGYVVAAPSIHPNGRPYAWENHPQDYTVARADPNVMAFIRHAQRSKRTSAKFTLPAVIEKGKRDDTLFKMACSLQSLGYDDDLIHATVESANKTKCRPPLSEAEVRKCVESALSFDKGTGKPQTGHVSLMLNSNGGPQQTIENCARVLANDEALAGRFRYNTVAYTKTVELPLPWDSGTGVRPVLDSDYSGLAQYLERAYGLRRKGNAIDAVTNVAMANRYNPLIERLDSLSWDGTERMDTLLPCFLGADMNDYTISVTRLFMFGAVARAYEPGTKFDYMPVLIGTQGLGKSMFLRRLAGSQEWFCDNFNTVEGDAAAEKLRGMWIVELAELLATKRTKDVESIKAFITSTVDTIRPKYARETEQRPRVCVFAGTTNNPQFLTDTTGNRRFLPVTCKPGAPMSLFEDGVEAYFEQAWAEAVHKWKTERPPLYLDEQTQAYAIQKQEDHLEDDVRVGLIQDYLDALEADAKVCIAELCERALGLDKRDYQGKRSLSNELHNIMANKVAGWRRMEGTIRVAGYGVQRCYARLETIESETKEV